jgi:hypothetical protein
MFINTMSRGCYAESRIQEETKPKAARMCTPRFGGIPSPLPLVSAKSRKQKIGRNAMLQIFEFKDFRGKFFRNKELAGSFRRQTTLIKEI